MIDLTKEQMADLLIERIAYYGIDKDIRNRILGEIENEELYTFACKLYDEVSITYFKLGLCFFDNLK
ncbi:MAG: hypothetical protein FWG67_06935 [Defluviitaleaceae bacterium]|nr:hypothetical protein [Defluviitaleaceae bacterium]